MKTQMRFQKIICLVMILVGALALAYSFCYATGGLAELGQMWDTNKNKSMFKAAEGKYNAQLFFDIQGFNDALMYCGIVIILLGVLLYITACNRRRKYYVTNFVATGVCAGGNIGISIALMVINGIWMGRFKNIDFVSWAKTNKDNMQEFIDDYIIVNKGEYPPEELLAAYKHYSESTTWFTIGFVVYSLVIVASLLLILNLVWKVALMKGEKQLLNGAVTVEEGAAV